MPEEDKQNLVDIDTSGHDVDDKLEAIRLAKEYELCFEDGWTIRIEKINLKNKNNYGTNDSNDNVDKYRFADRLIIAVGYVNIVQSRYNNGIGQYPIRKIRSSNW